MERELGRGGMGVVYLAHDLRLHRPTALKVLRPELTCSIERDRFLQEIEIEASLQHPNILPLFDAGEQDGGAEAQLGVDPLHLGGVDAGDSVELDAGPRGHRRALG